MPQCLCAAQENSSSSVAQRHQKVGHPWKATTDTPISTHLTLGYVYTRQKKLFDERCLQRHTFYH